MDMPETIEAGPISLRRWSVDHAEGLDQAINESLPDLMQFMPLVASASWSADVHSGYTGQGYATAAALALTEAALKRPDVEGVEIHHDVENPASGRVAAKAGFVRLGPIKAEMKAPADSGTHLVWVCRRPH